MKSVLALAVALLLLVGVSTPAEAQTSYTVKDGNGVPLNFKSVVIGGVTAPEHIIIDPITGTPVNVTGGGALEIDGSSTVQPVSVSAATYGACSALCASDVLKASPGTLYSFEVSADATLSGAIWYVMIFDATSLPADGSVTPAKCYQQPAGTTQMGGTLGAGGVALTTGIVIGVSSTGCFSKTASTHAYISGDFK